MANEHDVDGAKVRAWDSLAKFLDALTALVGKLDRMADAELADRKGGRS